MPRRGGRDRFKINQRTLVALVAQHRHTPTPAEVNAQRDSVREAKTHENGRVGLSCTHGVVPWTSCTTCSKPRPR